MQIKKIFNEDFLLGSVTSRLLFHNYAKKLPIIDYHCHIEAQEIVENKRFSDLAEIWLTNDHYKWRLMRSCGIDERYITGGAEPWDKFKAFATMLPQCAGNPVYHWSHLELQRYFDCDLPISRDTASEIWEHCSAKMPTVREVIEQSNVEIIVTTDMPNADLQWHDKLHNEGYNTRVLPGLRLDSAVDNPGDIFVKFAKSGSCTVDIGTFDINLIKQAAPEIATRGWTMLLHLGAIRDVNMVLERAVGKNSGGDIMGSGIDIVSLGKLFGELHNKDILPKTIVFSLNPNDNATINALTGAFPNVTQGPAWWFNDTEQGIAKQLCDFANMGVLAAHPGMLTDCRSIMSFVRHEYFRRILCNMLGNMVERGEYPMDISALSMIITRICHDNAASMFS